MLSEPEESVNDSNNEKNNIGMTTSGNILQTLCSGIKSIGTKCTIVVSTANITGLETSYAPSRVPCFHPFCLY